MEILDDDLKWFVRSSGDLKRNGIVVPGIFIQANRLLFKWGNDDHPGELLFPLSNLDNTAVLTETANKIYSLKGKEFDDSEDAFFSNYLADGQERVQGIEVSSRICPTDRLYVSTTIFYRRDLPGKVLDGKLYPILVSPKSLVAMILPSDLWSDEGWKLYRRYSSAY